MLRRMWKPVLVPLLIGVLSEMVAFVLGAASGRAVGLPGYDATLALLVAVLTLVVLLAMFAVAGWLSGRWSAPAPPRGATAAAAWTASLSATGLAVVELFVIEPMAGSGIRFPLAVVTGLLVWALLITMTGRWSARLATRARRMPAALVALIGALLACELGFALALGMAVGGLDGAGLRYVVLWLPASISGGWTSIGPVGNATWVVADTFPVLPYGMLAISTFSLVFLTTAVVRARRAAGAHKGSPVSG